MHFNRSDIENVKEYVASHAEDINLMVGEEDEARFNDTVNNILESHQYEEGEDIDLEHLNALKANVDVAIKNLSEYLIKNADTLKGKVDLSDPVEYLESAIDVFYVSAMEKLGCPDMPLFHFDANIKKTVGESASAIHRSFVTYDSISKDNTFKSQRGKNADEVRTEFGRHFKEIKDGKKSEAIAKMIAEYQALKERQRNHGAIWRMFHRGENKARNDLIKHMNKTIKSFFPNDMKKIKLDDAIPAEIAYEFADARIKSNLDAAAPRRYDPQTSSDFFGCAPVDEEVAEQQRILADTHQKQQMSKDENFVKDVIGSDGVRSEYVNEQNGLSKDPNNMNLI